MEIATAKKQEEENLMENLPQKRRKENGCFDYNKRLLLEGYLIGKKGYPKLTGSTELAKIFDCDRKTIYNEKKRGLVEHAKSDLGKILECNADHAQQNADWENTARGRKQKNRERLHPVRRGKKVDC